MLGEGFHLDEASRDGGKAEHVAVNLVGIRLLHLGIVLRGYGAESLAVVRDADFNAARIKHPVALFYACMYAGLRERLRTAEIHDCFEVGLREAEPAAGAVVCVGTRKAVYQHHGTVELITAVDGLEQADGAGGRLGKCETFLLRARAARVGAVGGGLEGAVLADFHRALVERRLLRGLRAVERVADFGVVHRGHLGADHVLHGVDDIFRIHLVNVAGIVVAERVVVVDEAHEAFEEFLIIFLLRLRPLYFGESRHAREFHVLHLAVGRHVFAPKVGLHADDILLLFGRKLARHRFVAIHAVERQIAADGLGLVGHVLGLIVVEIEIGVRRHDYGVVLTRSLDAARLAAPRHHGGIGREAALERLVPANHLPPERIERLLGVVDDVALQAFLGRVLAVGLQVVVGNALLAGGALRPLRLGTLISAHVDIL